jgi:DNA-binding CsgD family transcriptional regulator
MRRRSDALGTRQTFRDILPALVAIAFQVLACVYFVGDALLDQSDPATSGVASAFEIIIALALMAGIILGAAYIMRLIREARIREASVAVARGAMSRILSQRFVEWGLSAAEADVALFALKGCTVAEIAYMRAAARGTVRAQLSQVYAKAGVSSQPMLMSLFLEELMTGEELSSPP